MKVREVMTSQVASCRPDSNLAVAAKAMWDHDCGALPVIDSEGRVVGMITDRDICIAVATRHRHACDISVGDVISDAVYTGAPSDDLQVALRTMQDRKVRRLPVVDPAGRLLGILSINDAVLEAQNVRAGVSRLSFEQVMSALKAICAHRNTPAVKTTAA